MAFSSTQNTITACKGAKRLQPYTARGAASLLQWHKQLPASRYKGVSEATGGDAMSLPEQ